MTTLRDKIANERRRLRSVRQTLTAAVEQQSAGDETFRPFYIAATDYLEASMGRLHAQDVKMGDMILEKADAADNRVEQALKELDERLSGNQAHLEKLLNARTALQNDGAETLANFEETAKAYMNYIIANMGHHGATTELAGELFSQDDWEYMAGVTDEEMEREMELYQRVSRTTPASVTVPEDAA